MQLIGLSLDVGTVKPLDTVDVAVGRFGGVRGARGDHSGGEKGVRALVDVPLHLGCCRRCRLRDSILKLHVLVSIDRWLTVHEQDHFLLNSLISKLLLIPTTPTLL